VFEGIAVNVVIAYTEDDPRRGAGARANDVHMFD
jgi:hypothetical protein